MKMMYEHPRKPVISNNAAKIIVFFIIALMLQSFFKAEVGYNYDDSYDYGNNSSEKPYLAELNMNPAQFVEEYGDKYEIKEMIYEYSADIPRGKMIRAEQQPGDGVKTQLRAVISLGPDYLSADEKCDFKNCIDPEKYFAMDDIHPYIISYNVFYAPDGSKREVMFHRAGGGGLEGRQYVRYISADGKFIEMPCSYDSGGDALSYSFNSHFALQLEDYNNDGCPDFIYKAGSVDKRGGCYKLHITDSEVHYTSLGKYSNDDVKLYIYGTADDSPRLDRIDRDTFFYLTKNDEGNVVPVLYSCQPGYKNVSDYENNGWIFTSFYEDGVIELKGTSVGSKSRYYNSSSVNYLTALVRLKKLDETVWRYTDLPEFTAEFSAKNAQSDTAVMNLGLERGVYRLEVTVGEKCTYTEFIVRQDTAAAEDSEQVVQENETAAAEQEEDESEKAGQEEAEPEETDANHGKTGRLPFMLASPKQTEEAETAASGESSILTLSDIRKMPSKDLAGIKTLSVSLDPWREDAGILGRLTGLEELTIYTQSNYQDNDGFDFLKNCTKLKSLSISADGAIFDMKCIWADDTLEELSLEGFHEIRNFDRVSGYKKLESLSLGSSKGTIIFDFDSVADIRNLKKLSLCRIMTTKSMSYGNFDLIGSIASLEELELDSFLAAKQMTGLENLKNLRSLRILNCKNLGDYSFICELTSLEKFVYTEDAVDSEQLERFKEAVPGCEVFCALS